MSDDELKLLVSALPSNIHGTGLFSRRDIAQGEYIGTFHGSEVKVDGEHVLWVEVESAASKYIGICGENLLRYLNHDSPGNAEFSGQDLFARVDIASGEEITLDYSG
ncbi:MAG: SET domain-containing protein [Gammaproteobacteria bacterium]|nr:SET domain-containing protein [Gammaproteobacteria bacterium]